MEDRLHLPVCAEVFKAELFEFTLSVFQVEAKVLPGVGIGTDGDYLPAKFLVYPEDVS